MKNFNNPTGNITTVVILKLSKKLSMIMQMILYKKVLSVYTHFILEYFSALSNILRMNGHQKLSQRG